MKTAIEKNAVSFISTIYKQYLTTCGKKFMKVFKNKSEGALVLGWRKIQSKNLSKY